MNHDRDHDQPGPDIRTAGFDRRRLLPRLASLSAALAVALVKPESADARKGKRRKHRRKHRDDKDQGNGNSNGGGGDPLDAEEQTFLTLINNHRAANGRAALAAQGQLTAAAARHSRDMAANSFFEHTGSDGTDAGQRIDQAGYEWRSWGENIYWNGGDGSANAAFVAWRNSPDHNTNMLDPDFTEIGIARIRAASGRWYWTTTFGDR